ncbi:MAG: bifunctional riboflavin kinase/FAD synthetase [Candidatus Hydrogenedentes bacterium]|nr:bifunctional riboflavin kinase/FAD synthetase [Candidatus Hydrogenedentota bacterium]
MIVVENVHSFNGGHPHVVLTIGSFDGVHLGHQCIINTVVKRARSANGSAAVLTMRPHPREFFSPAHAPNLLTSDETKLKLFERLGLDIVFFLPFNAESAALDRREFVTRIVRDRCQARHLVVGHDFCFGRDALGDFSYLNEVAPEFGFTVEQAPPVIVEGERVSSTLIREQVLAGDLERTEAFLGRKYSVSGTVVTGRGMGAKLGFPTANIRPHHTAIPAQGVYAAEAIFGGVARAAAVNIGVAPTIRNEDPTVEAFVLDFHGDLVGQTIDLVFHKRLRSERKFPSVEALQTQIRADVESVRECVLETNQSES